LRLKFFNLLLIPVLERCIDDRKTPRKFGNILELRIGGRLTEADYSDLLVQEMEKAMKATRRGIRMNTGLKTGSGFPGLKLPLFAGWTGGQSFLAS
jgi:hypothetical protein